MTILNIILGLATLVCACSNPLNRCSSLHLAGGARPCRPDHVPAGRATGGSDRIERRAGLVTSCSSSPSIFPAKRCSNPPACTPTAGAAIALLVAALVIGFTYGTGRGPGLR